MDVESPWRIHKKLRSCKTMIPAYIAIYFPFTIDFPITLWAWTSQNSQTHSNILSAKAGELLGCVWLLCGVGA